MNQTTLVNLKEPVHRSHWLLNRTTLVHLKEPVQSLAHELDYTALFKRTVS